MQAIQTKYLPPTNSRGSAIKATAERGSITVRFHSIDATHDDEKFAIVARMLCDKFVAEDVKKYGSKPEQVTWSRPFVTGGLPGGGYAHVFTS